MAPAEPFLRLGRVADQEVDLLVGDPSKARKRLGWLHKTSFDAMVKEMVAADLAAVRRETERKSRHD